MRTQSSLAVSDRIQFHRQQPRRAGTRWLVHRTHRCMLGMRLSRHAAASALRTKSDCSLQKNCSELLRQGIIGAYVSESHGRACMAEPRTPSNNRGQHAAVHRQGARVRQLPLIFPHPPSLAWVPGNTATSNRVWFAIEPECCGFTDRFRLCIVCHISIYRRLTGATRVQR